MVLLLGRLQGGGQRMTCIIYVLLTLCQQSALGPSSKDITCTLSHLCVVCVHVCILCMVLYAHYKNVWVVISCSASLVTSQIVYLPHAIRAPQFWRKFSSKN